jgi:anti-sigma B factor antagonist
VEIHERPCDIEGVRLLALDGGLDHSNTGPFIERMYALLDEGTHSIVLDLGGLTYVSSWGLASLVRVHHHCATRGGQIVFANLHSAVASLLHISHLERLFDLHATVEEALKAVRQDADGPEETP